MSNSETFFYDEETERVYIDFKGVMEPQVIFDFGIPKEKAKEIIDALTNFSVNCTNDTMNFFNNTIIPYQYTNLTTDIDFALTNLAERANAVGKEIKFKGFSILSDTFAWIIPTLTDTLNDENYGENSTLEDVFIFNKNLGANALGAYVMGKITKIAHQSLATIPKGMPFSPSLALKWIKALYFIAKAVDIGVAVNKHFKIAADSFKENPAEIGNTLTSQSFIFSLLGDIFDPKIRTLLGEKRTIETLNEINGKYFIEKIYTDSNLVEYSGDISTIGELRKNSEHINDILNPIMKFTAIRYQAALEPNSLKLSHFGSTFDGTGSDAVLIYNINYNK